MIKSATTFRNPRSVALTKEEIKKLKSHRRNFETNKDCASSLGLDRVVYDRVCVYGTASLATVQKIRIRLAEMIDYKSTK